MPINNLIYNPVSKNTFLTSEDIPAFRFVNFVGSLPADNSKSFGVTESAWGAGEYASCVTLGTVTVETAGAVVVGDDVTSDSLGRAKPVSGSEKVNGRALTTAASTGFITIQLVP